MAHGVDYSTDHPNPAQLARLGIVFAVRYLTGLNPGKAITPLERDSLHEAGISVVLGYETTGTECLGGEPAGVEHGRLAVAAADQLGAPDYLPIYFAVDFNIQPDDIPAMVAYFRGIATVIPAERIGIYGGLAAINAAKMHNCATWLWQTYAWSAGRWALGLHLRQIRNAVPLAGGEVDLDDSMQPDFGGWDPMATVDISPASIAAIAAAVTGADVIPHGQTPANPTWQVGNALGWDLHITEDAAPTVAQLYTLLTGQAPATLPAGVPQAAIDAAKAARPAFLADLAAAVWALAPSAGTGVPGSPAA